MITIYVIEYAFDQYGFVPYKVPIVVDGMSRHLNKMKQDTLSKVGRKLSYEDKCVVKHQHWQCY